MQTPVVIANVSSHRGWYTKLRRLVTPTNNSLRNQLLVLWLLVIMICSSFWLATQAKADSQLMVTPTRVVFDPTMRNAQVSLINSGDATGTYRISLVNKRMTQDGKFEDITTPQDNEQFADKMIRFSPRQVVLEPGKAQVVRLSLRKPSKLKDGEYRSHMLFKAVPANVGNDIKQAAKNNNKNISINLKAIVSISIPVIVRQGKTNVSVEFASVSYQPATNSKTLPSLRMEMQRTGNESAYGDLLAEFVQDNGTSTVIGQVNGIAVYTPNKNRIYQLPLRLPKDLNLKQGTIRVYYRSPADKGGKVLANSQLKLP